MDDMTRMKIVRLRCEYLVNPIGLDESWPRLSWIMESGARGARQTARQIQVASDAVLLATGVGNIWDTGRVENDASAQIAYAGTPLEPRKRYWWRARIWDGSGSVSQWSESAFWETGLLTDRQWDAEWISVPERDGKSSEPCPFLRRLFDCPTAPTRARLYVTALGLYECHLNGKRVGADCFTPGWTEYQIRIPYQTYDVTAMLHQGENALGAILGDGWACSNLVDRRAVWSKQPFLKALLVLEYADGRSEIVRTDRDWRVGTGPILESDIYNGETYDARLEIPGWDASGFDDSLWTPAWSAPDNPDEKQKQPVIPPQHGPWPESKAAFSAKPGPVGRRIMELPALDRSEPTPGVHIFDFGQNFAGRLRLRIAAPSGTVITLRHGEMLQQNGTLYTENLHRAKASDRYICRGGAEETWEPRFTYHGFRFVELTGCPEAPPMDMLTGVVLHADMELTARFSCSNPLINKLQKCIEWGQRSNFLDVPTDSPQRNERLGWTGDAQVFIPTACYTMDVAAFFTKWCRDMEDAQTADGAFRHVVPNVTHWFGSAAWSDAGVICPWTIYRFYGDTRILERHYASMGRWVDYMERTSRDLIRPEEGYGDWLNPDHASDGTSLGPPPRMMIGTAYFARCATLMEKTAALLGRVEDARRYADLAERVRAAFRRTFVLPSGKMCCGTASGKCQTAYLLTLAFDLLPEESRAATFRNLLELIEQDDWHMRTGFVGTPLMNPTLSAMGRTDIAYRLLLQESCPSWLYPVLNGATTMWERWNSYTVKDGPHPNAGMNSFNHYAYGAIGEWLYAVVGGIAPDPDVPGFKRFRIQPCPGSGIDSAEMTMESLYGTILCRWFKTADALRVTTSIPPNTTATIVLPCGHADTARVNGAIPAEADGISGAHKDGGFIVMEAVSGEYEIEINPAEGIA
jgi:alpha-L-rhamnosidase